MRYFAMCIFDERLPCPLHKFYLEVDGGLCGACADTRAVEGMKAQTIAQLLMTFQSEEKAKEIYEKVVTLVRVW